MACGRIESAQRLHLRMNNYFARHWRGEFSLARTYWLNCFGVTFVLQLLIRVSNLFSSELSSVGFAVFETVVCVSSIGLWIWQIVGLWRASVCRAASPNGLFPSWLGRGVAALWVVGLGVFVFSWAIPRYADAISVFNDDSVKAMRTAERIGAKVDFHDNVAAFLKT